MLVAEAEAQQLKDCTRAKRAVDSQLAFNGLSSRRRGPDLNRRSCAVGLLLTDTNRHTAKRFLSALRLVSRTHQSRIIYCETCRGLVNNALECMNSLVCAQVTKGRLVL